ncbi:MAG TPA: PRC-barrel domain-containing protein [Sphingomicrobium sp.]|nr:PRC-barrel domain-containing protein [Sphingomicrobium sp.]
MELITSWVAPIATIAGVLITASNLGARITGYGFIVFTIGSINWTLLGIATGQPALIWTNLLLTGLNVFGIWRWLGRQSRIESGARTAADRSEDTPGEALFPVSLLSRASLVNDDGRELGSCIDAMAGCNSGRIAYVVVSEGGVAGVGETLRRLPWHEARVSGDQLKTRLAAERFCGLDPIAPDNWPER